MESRFFLSLDVFQCRRRIDGEREEVFDCDGWVSELVVVVVEMYEFAVARIVEHLVRD